MLTFSNLPLPPYTTAGVCVMASGTNWQVMEVKICVPRVFEEEGAMRCVQEEGGFGGD